MDCTDLICAMILQGGLTFNPEPWSQFILTSILFAINHPTNLIAKDVSVFFERLKPEDVFEFIHKHNLFKSINTQIVLLMDFNTEKALELLMKNIDSIPVSWLLYSLRESPNFLSNDYTFMDHRCIGPKWFFPWMILLFH